MAKVSNLTYSIDELNTILEHAERLPNPALLGKTIVNFGDSIFGQSRPPLDISTGIANITGATVYNCGFGGTQMTLHTNALFTPFSMCNLANAVATKNFTSQETAANDSSLPTYFKETVALLKKLDFSKIDIVTISFGTNDFMNQDALTNPSNLYDHNTFEGALKSSIETLLTAFPNLKIFLCTPTYRFWENGSYDSDTYMPATNKLTDFVDSVKKIGLEYHLPVIDNYNELGINKFNRYNYIPQDDGVHPNQSGRDLIARHISRCLF